MRRKPGQTPAAQKRAAVHAIVQKLPSTGDSVYHALPWSSPDGITRANCYAYALDAFDPTSTTKLQPGDLAARRRGYTDRHAEALATGAVDKTTCSNIRTRMQDDLGDDVYVERPRTPCQQGFYKIMLSIARNKTQNDYHYYVNFQHLLLDESSHTSLAEIAHRYQVPVQNITRKGSKVFVRDANVWASKHGFATGALLKDTCGKPIFDPRLACRKVNDLDYKIMCDSFCVRDKKGRKLSK